MWGNKKSLRSSKDNTILLEELKKWFKEYYSADRMKLAIMVKSKDNLQNLRKWVETSFSIIENREKNIGQHMQDFSKIDGCAKEKPESACAGTLPY